MDLLCWGNLLGYERERETEKKKTFSARARQTEGYKVPGILSLRHPPLANNSTGSPNEPRVLQDEVETSFHFISYCCSHRILVNLLDLGGEDGSSPNV